MRCVEGGTASRISRDCARHHAEQARPVPAREQLCVVCAGTSDLPVAEEAAVTARLMGNTVELIADVGVAGIHRLLAQKTSLQSARVLIVCAGMEGALPTVVGGAGECAGAGGAHQRGLWSVVWRRGGAAGDAEHLLAQCVGGQHRQRVRRGLHRFAYQSFVRRESGDASRQLSAFEPCCEHRAERSD